MAWQMCKICENYLCKYLLEIASIIYQKYQLSCLLIGVILMAFLVEMFIPDQQEDMSLKCFENMVRIKHFWH